MTNDTPHVAGISRPATADDLADYQREGVLLSHVYLGEFAECGEMITAYGSFVQAAKAAGHDVRPNGEIRRAVTADDLAVRLENAQREWDVLKDKYLKALETGVEPEFGAWAVKEWCRKEGLAYPIAEAAQS
ncbi:DUF7432 family protein [Prescottella equi]|nr:hypothetical protein [Prescottella equi]